MEIREHPWVIIYQCTTMSCSILHRPSTSVARDMLTVCVGVCVCLLYVCVCLLFLPVSLCLTSRPRQSKASLARRHAVPEPPAHPNQLALG